MSRAVNQDSNWVGQRPIFYNEVTGARSYRLQDVVDWNDCSLDREGLYYYLRLGYSGFGRTFVKNVKFSRAWDTDSASSEIFCKFVDKLDFIDTDPDEAFLSISDWFLRLTADKSLNLIIPTSGGLDSRLLNIFCQQPEMVDAFSYSLMRDPAKCREVQVGKAVCDALGIRHRVYEFTQPFDLRPDWNELFDFEIHEHGMYQLEFYRWLSESNANKGTVISGIVGDLWAGKPRLPDIYGPNDLLKLGYSHGQSVPLGAIAFKTDLEGLQADFDKFGELFKSRRFRILYLIQTKMMLLRYLIDVPRSLGFGVESPFLDPQIAFKFLTIPENLHEDRRWQFDFLEKQGLGQSFTSKIKVPDRNEMNFIWSKSFRFPLLDESLFDDLIDDKFIASINFNLQHMSFSPLISFIFATPKLGGALRSIGLNDPLLSALHAYNILMPVQRFLLRCRNV